MINKLLAPLALVIGLALALATGVYAHRLAPEPDAQVEIADTALSSDELIDMVAGDPNTLDPAWNYESIGDDLLRQIYDPLLTLKRDKADEFVPMLATGWEISPDGEVYTFTIRQGVRFHNGAALTPEDVAYSFQRGLLQGGGFSPQWLYTEALFGVGIYDVACLVDGNVCEYQDDRDGLQTVNPATLLAVCQQVTGAIVADTADWTVSFHLAQPWSPFLSTLVGSWGSILDKDWTVAQGGWDGNCATWQNYYDVDDSTTPLGEVTNGTGPFKLDHWTHNQEIVLSRHDGYWRQTPMWEGGPTGPAKFSQVTVLVEPDGPTRAQMLVDGSTDLADLSIGAIDAISDHVMLSYDQADGLIPTLEHPEGTLAHYKGGVSPSAWDAFFVYDIQIGGNRNYIGSGMLDGDGIPPDFFEDIHVRKAFNYAFDWERYIDTVFLGHAIQRSGPIAVGLPGYTPTQPTYSYNPPLAIQEFGLAWGGDVVTHGFVFTLTYDEGNIYRQTVAEILKEEIEALNPDFHINVVSLDWDDFIPDHRNGRIPIFLNGWGQDIPHPHNWLYPYLIGTYALRQRLPESMSLAYEGMVETCLSLSGEAARSCYEDIQHQTFLDVKDIYLAQSNDWRAINAEVQGYYQSQTFRNVFYYMLSKGPLPTHEQVEPGVEETIVFTSSLGAQITATVGAGTVTDPMQIVATADIVTNGEPQGFQLGGLSFALDAFDASGDYLENVTFDDPLVLTLEYTDEMVELLNESTLQLFWWDGAAWVDAACGAVVRDPLNNVLQIPICHLSDFSIGGVTYEVMLPLVMR